MTKFYIYISLLAILDLIAIMSAKYWNVKGNLFYLLISIFCFALVAVFFALSLRYEGAVIVNIIWVALSTILVGIFGYLLFKETITPLQIVGIFVIILGIVLIEIK